MAEQKIASAQLYKTYRDYKTYKPKIITVNGSKISSDIIDEQIFKSEQAAKDYATMILTGKVKASA